jgi:hypothetical protein
LLSSTAMSVSPSDVLVASLDVGFVSLSEVAFDTFGDNPCSDTSDATVYAFGYQ